MIATRDRKEQHGDTKVFLLSALMLERMRRYSALVLVMAVLLTAGCVEEPAPANATAGLTTPATSVPPGGGASVTGTPTPVPTPPPEAMAFISGITCGMGDKLNQIYHCSGDIRIRSIGSYDAVQVITVFSDKNTFRSNIVSLGGTEAISKQFVYFPDAKYQGETPTYFVRLDDKVYPVVWNGGMGTALSNTPGAEGIEIR